MIRTSRLSLLLGAAGLAVFTMGCSSPDDGGGGPMGPPNNGNPFGMVGQGGAPVTGMGGSPGVVGQGGLPNQVGQGGAPVTGMGGAATGMGGAATGMGGGTGAIPVGMGTVITPDPMGWVAGSTNMFGIQGSFYTFSDATAGGDTTMTMPDFAGGRVCVSGVASQVLPDPATAMPAYGTYWGGGVGFNLADAGTMMGPGPWSRGNVTGFSFNITGPTPPPAGQFRFKATFFQGTTIIDTYCAGNVAAGPNTFAFATIVNECYPGGLGAPALDPAAPLAAIQWQVSTIETASTPFDFCIENLTPVTQ